MKVKCLKDVYGEGKLLFLAGNSYDTSVYGGILSAQMEDSKPYPLGYEAIAHDVNEDWNRDEWFRHYFEIQ